MTAPGERRSIRKTLTGTVLRTSMRQAAVIEVQGFAQDPRYGKRIRVRRRILARTGGEPCGPGDRVEILQTRPLSRRIRWRVSRVLKAAARPSTDRAPAGSGGAA